MTIPERLRSAIKSGKVVLFLGAGANYNCKMTNGQTMPTAEQLAELLSKKFNVRKSTLSETSELVGANHTRPELNAFIIELLTGATPSEGFKLINSFKWSSIYTTNYDLLVENIYNDPTAVQKLKVYYTSVQHIDLGPDDVPLYKLHGCISRADTTEGRLVITPDDYAEYRKHRARLFYRLADNLADKPFLYIGYGRQDSNFRTILAEVHSEMFGNIPEGYALSPNKTDEDDIVWKKKGITLIDMDVDEFLKILDKETNERYSDNNHQFDFPVLKQYEKLNLTEIQEVLSYFSLPISKYGAKINPNDFYKGSEADWMDIQNKVDAERDIYDEIMGNFLEDALSIDKQTTSYCILAEAGTGKSTILRRMAFDLCHDFQQLVFWYKGERRINYGILETIYKATGMRIFIFVDRGSKFLGNLETIRRDCLATKIPITLIIADRTNEWNSGSINNFRYTKNWTLGRLSDIEISKILKKLEEFNCLGNLADFTSEQRIETFKGFSDRQLLIALREATEGKNFDELIIEELESIPDEIARRAYIHICAMNAFGKGIRTTSLARSLGINFSNMNSVFLPLYGLIDEKDDVYKARHAVIAKIVFFSISEAARIDILDQLIKHLDLGYTTDYHIFKNLSNNPELVDSVGGIETRRRLFETLKQIQPTDAYIEQHEARMEIRSVNEGGSLDRAEQLIKNALRKTENAISIKHTAGLLYIERSKQSKGLEKRACLTKAIQEFIELTKRESANEYAWVSLIESRISLGNTNEELKDKLAEYARAEADYQKALECCGITPFLLKAKGKIEAALGHGEEAREFYKKAINGIAPPVSLFSNYIKWELRHKNIPAAKEASRRAIELYKTNPDIVILRAKSLILGLDFNLAEVAQLLIEIQRSASDYYRLEAHFWYGIAQWETNKYTEALSQFQHCKELAITIGRGDIKYIRYISGMNTGNPKEYIGSIIEKGPRIASIITNPGGVKVFINPSNFKDYTEKIKVRIGFNRLGPVAISEKECEDFLYDNIV